MAGVACDSPPPQYESLDSRRRLKALEEGVHPDPSGVFDRQVPELLGHVAENGHAMVECEVSEQDIPRLEYVHVVLEEPFFIQVRLVNFALGPVLLDEPVIAKRLRILR